MPGANGTARESTYDLTQMKMVAKKKDGSMLYRLPDGDKYRCSGCNW